MLRALRNKSQSFLFKIFLVLIVIGFAAWGVGDLTGNRIPPATWMQTKFIFSLLSK